MATEAPSINCRLYQVSCAWQILQALAWVSNHQAAMGNHEWFTLLKTRIDFKLTDYILVSLMEGKDYRSQDINIFICQTAHFVGPICKKLWGSTGYKRKLDCKVRLYIIQ